jgi:hypothetical protein
VYDAQGTYKWGRVVGRDADTSGTGVSADGLGGVYISGVTNGDVAGPNAGQRDAFLARFGTGEWQAQLGTAQNDEGADVSADGLGNIYITGSTYGSLAGPAAGGGDAFLAKYDTQGAFQWMRQLGTPGDDGSAGVAADGLGNVYISGSTGGDLGGPNAGGSDAFLAKYDPTGNLLWTRQFGSAQSDESRGVSADGIGGVYITGLTYGSLAGPNAGDSDAFIAKYDSAGNFQWARQWGGAFYDRSDDVSADGLGNAYITGQTWISNHEIAGFLVKYGTPEPSSVSLMLVILITAGINARRR